MSNKQYTLEFKVIVVEKMQKKLSYEGAKRQFNLPHYLAADWERIYLAEGPEGLSVERRGRACAASGTKKDRPAKLPASVEKVLLAETQRLRAENAYLKNLQALVLEDERKALVIWGLR